MTESSSETAKDLSLFVKDASGILTKEDFRVPTLGECVFPTTRPRFQFVNDNERILLQSRYTNPKEVDPSVAFEVAVQGAKKYFNPAETTVGIITCGGLCPGLNDVFIFLFV
jgi:6-phosphofructokinase 1